MIFETEEIRCVLYVHSPTRTAGNWLMIPCKKEFWNSKSKTRDTRWIDVLCKFNLQIFKGDTIQVIGELSMNDEKYSNKEGVEVSKQAIKIFANEIKTIKMSDWVALQKAKRNNNDPF